MKPKSRGTVRLASADPQRRSRVDPNYFADPADVDAYVASVELAIAIGNGPGFERMRKEQVSIPRRQPRGRSSSYIRANAATYFHFVGTCAMGKDASAPVDPKRCALRGVSPAARRRRLGHARGHLLQHPRADAGACRARRRDRAGGRTGG